ncbi:MAG: helix-turn-helix domain-containing protein [Pseudomonadota bacterium]|nr:helix-turn-helix domain-containing protein [Pseudomonadota bacterium]
MEDTVNRPPGRTAGPSGADGGKRTLIRGIQAMPAAIDKEIAIIFQEMRRAAHLEKAQLSDQLRTPVSVIDALESGILHALPSWPETIRVVNAYTRMLGLDPRPILRRIRSQLDAAGVVRPAPPAAKPAVPKAQPPSAPIGEAAPVRPEPEPAPRAAPPAEAVAVQHRPQPVPESENIDESIAASAEPDVPGVTQEDADFSEDEAGTSPPERGVLGWIRLSARWIFILALCGALGYAISHAVRNPDGVAGFIDRLPEPIPSAARLIRDIVAPARNSKASETTPPPRNEKSDRLPEGQAPAVR